MDELTVKIAAIKIGTFVLGPGYRMAIWVQGCPFSCKGCISPEWIRPGGIEISTTQLVDIAMRDEKIEGITLSGGEPMLQAIGLSYFLRKIKQLRPHLNIICFTGYKLDYLLRNPPNNGVKSILDEIDLLIDGPYIEKKNNNLGLRGSSNQKFHFLSEKLKNFDFENIPRKVEIEIQNGFSFIVGIPTREFHKTWNEAISKARKELSYERSQTNNSKS